MWRRQPTTRQFSPPRTAGAARRARTAARLTSACGIAAISLAIPATAYAHGDEGAVPARDSVLQAIAYVVNAPGDMDMIRDKLKDAEDSQNKQGVDLAEVAQAMSALDKGDMPRVRLLLEESIGARADLSGMDVRHVLQLPPGSSTISLATGQQAGTQIVTAELPGRGVWSGTDSVLLAVAAVAAALGAVLSWRFRPVHSVHALRRQAGPAGDSADSHVGG